MKCLICGQKLGKMTSTHFVRKHKISSKDYYDLYLKKNEEDRCLTCGKKTNFHTIKTGYKKYCSTSCVNKSQQHKNSVKNTKQKRYGDPYYCNPDKIKETLIERFGVDHNFKSEHSKNKIKKTNLERYGVENAGGAKQILEKINKTNIERYGVKWATQLEKNITARMSANYSKTHKKLFETLKNINDNFIKEYHVPQTSFIVDIYLPDKKLIIECLGDYWHCNPIIYNENYYNTHLKMTAKQRWQQDEIRKNILEKLGYRFLYFWNKDVNLHFDKILNQILEELK